jgi:hypothetical protein
MGFTERTTLVNTVPGMMTLSRFEDAFILNNNINYTAS